MTAFRPPIPHEELLRLAYHPSSPPARLFERLMRELMRHTGALSGRLHLRELGTLIEAPIVSHAAFEASVDDAVAAAEWHAHEPGAPHVAIPARRTRSITVPIVYAGAELGELMLTWRSDGVLDEAVAALAKNVARACAFFAKRQDLRRFAEERFGRSVCFIGTSAPLLSMEEAIERAAKNALPVLIQGELGTEKAHAALAIHCAGSRRNGPFVEACCFVHPADAAAQVPRWFELARGGTLFLNGIDELTRDVQGQLVQLLCSRAGQWIGAPGASDVRVLASMNGDLRAMAKDGRFSKMLLAELDFLSVIVPPLRERTADIEPLVVDVLERHGFRPEQKRTDELMGICSTYAWPENAIELERTIARLAVTTDGLPIGRGHVAQLAPWMLHGEVAPPLAPPSIPPIMPPIVTPVVQKKLAPPAATVTERWARCVVNKDFTHLPELHDGMQRALLYLGDHYQEQISLGDIARQAHMSPSHLSYLFKISVGTTFKPFLGRVRVERAKEILASGAHQRITEIAMAVGFTDLSHFEKLFRRIVGESPRVFRRSRAAAAPHLDA